jgi:hypothetical protein
MHLAELKKQAASILAIPDTVGEFANKSFCCRSGGAPSNKVGVPEVHRAEDFAYNTTANGTAYRGEVVVLCRDTGAKDKNGRDILVTPEGVTFVFRRWAGSPSSFDGGVLESPEL